MILLQTLSFSHSLFRITDFGSGSVLPLGSVEPEADGTDDPKRARCPIMSSCMILLHTLGFGHPLSQITDFGSGSVLLLYSGELRADGTGDPKRVRCPIISSCIILLQTLSFGDPLFWGALRKDIKQT